MNYQRYLFSIYFLLFAILGFSQATVKITDADLVSGQTYNWTKNNTYLLDGLVFLETGGVLNIEAGTVVKFTARADAGNPSALVITKGAKINATGTAQNPIIFTAEADDVNNPTDLGPKDNALWGGLVILGNGVTQKSGNGSVSVEGIPTTEPRGIYGGNDNNDDSGVMRYVSIRHGGRQLVSGSELNGLSLGAVGSKTVLEYIEIYANSDDGIEFFGGAPNLKYAIVAFAEDDSFDWDEVYSGKGQFWFSIQRPDIADAGGEFDGTTPDDVTPYSNPTIYNWTHIGSGIGATAANPVGWLFKAGTAGVVANSIVTGIKGKVIEVQDKNTGANDAHQKLVKGELKIMNNIFFGNGSNAALDASATGVIRVTSGQPNQDNASGSDLIGHLTANKTSLENPGVISISRDADGKLDPRPTASGSAYTTALANLPAGDAFFSNVSHKGAFSANSTELWIKGWSTLARNGHLPSESIAGTTVKITDADLVSGQTYNWTKNNTYLLDGLVFLETGGVLNIEAGTVVKFTARADAGNPSALVITKGAKINATGTAQNPIIFTAEADDVNNPTDLGPKDNALWGGLVILGNGVTQKSGNGSVSVEGIPTTEPRGIYGGNDNNDDSGVMRYVSIRHGGRQLVSGSELNGLSLGAVGSKTVLEYIEIYANSDDGIEFFGGAPNLKYAIVAFAEDDSFDWDEVYSGKGQFWFSIQRPDIADAGGEFDGTTPDDVTPYSNPTIYNWTHIGSGIGATAANPVGWLFKAGTAGVVANSIVTGIKGKVIEVQDKNTGANDAHQKLVKGELKIMNNIFFGNGSNAALDASATGVIRVTSGQPNQDNASGSDLIGHLTANKTSLENPGVISISRDADGKLDPRPTASGSAYTTALANLPAGDAFFSNVSHKGAFSANSTELWIKGWSTLARNGHLPSESIAGTTVKITDADLVSGQTYNWTKNNTYLLDGLVFLETGGVLNIEAGTVVKFTARADAGNPSALVITKGAKINATGTAQNPIIFTAEADDVNNPTDLGPKDNALWGGLVILGNGVTQKSGNGSVSVEGIPTTEPRGIYGGNDNNDDSGVMRYVSIRHGGRQLVSGSELNGLSLGAVGSKTVLEYIEIYANSDDGIEFFGGAPNLKYAIVAFAEDDSFDWDEVYSGKGQFWFSIQRPDIADAGGEFDGTTPDDVTPYSNPTIYNWTHIGSGIGATAANPVGWLFKAGTAGVVANSIVTGIKGKVIEVQDKNTGANDAHQKLVKGELKIMNNIFFGNGSNAALDASATGVIRVTSGQPNQDNASGSDLIGHLTANKTSLENPGVISISRDADGKLDPRPTASGSAYTTALANLPAGDAFFSNVSHKGAFSANSTELWIKGWSTLARNGHLSGTATNNQEILSFDITERFKIYPNPVGIQETFTVEAEFSQRTYIDIFSMDGRQIRSVKVEKNTPDQFEMSGLERGMYLIKFTTEAGKFSVKKLIVE